MKLRVMELCMALCLLASLRAVGAPAAFADYALTIERNVFDSSRQPRPAQVAQEVVRPPEPPKRERSMVLVGVFCADDRVVALFVGDDRQCRNVTVGEKLESLELVEANTGGVVLHPGEGGDELKVKVGERLGDGGDGNWRAMGGGGQAPAIQAVMAERQAQEQAVKQQQQTAEQSEILRQMMERRRRELER